MAWYGSTGIRGQLVGSGRCPRPSQAANGAHPWGLIQPLTPVSYVGWGWGVKGRTGGG